MVLKLGLLCSHSDPNARPTMRQVLNYLNGDAKLPDLSPLDLRGNGMMMMGLHHKVSEIHFVILKILKMCKSVHSSPLSAFDPEILQGEASESGEEEDEDQKMIGRRWEEDLRSNRDFPEVELDAKRDELRDSIGRG
ncbi:unnamed protein product [Microthlaspi erraticum]|uniref:Serine-threonine/tyrosine-protein kinase catalytic domain-containing protein n=1 Tax=Microthlaspi erraticum TaxID=1685480 RepID=A0A6D2LH22_9BRAS|nr:unnamed protein product [Microthlaspi erraticum]